MQEASGEEGQELAPTAVYPQESDYGDSLLGEVVGAQPLLPLPVPGERLGGASGRRFEIQQSLGGGAMGEVYRAWDGELQRVVALKFLLPRTGLLGPGASELLTRQGEVKLLDFGLAHLVASASSLPHLPTAGTPQYMAPEQWRGEPQDERTDVWAAGILLFELLSGELPYAGLGLEEPRARVCSPQPMPSVRERCPELPWELEPLLASALAKEPGQRYTSAQELLEELRELAWYLGLRRAPTRPVAAERRPVTLLHCIPMGLPEGLDPEDLDELEAAFHQCCAELIERHGGTPTMSLGARVLACFGYPQAHEEDSVRAVCAALALAEHLPRQLGQRLRHLLPAVLAVQVGLHTDMVALHEGPAAGGGTLTLRGEAPEVVYWLARRAGPGQVLLSEATSARVRGAFEVVEEAECRLQAQCGAQFTASAFYPVAELLRRLLGEVLPEGLSPPAPGWLAPRLRALGLSAEHEQALASLLSLPPVENLPLFQLTPQRQKELVLEGLATLVQRLARERPVLAVVEDLHWADPSTLELVAYLVRRIGGERVLLLLSTRPELRYAPLQQPGVLTLRLERLGAEETAALLRESAQGRELPRELVQRLAARTDGVPLFVEEVMRMVLEREAAGGVPAAIPGTPEAGMALQAIAWWSKAGVRASLRSANQEAIGHLRRALELLRGLPEAGQRRGEELQLLVTLGIPLVQVHGYHAPEVERTSARIRELFSEVGEVLPRLELSYWGPFAYHVARVELGLAQELAERLVGLGERQRHRELLTLGHRMSAAVAHTRGQVLAAREHIESALRHARFSPEEHQVLVRRHFLDPEVEVLAHGSAILSLSGELSRARQWGQQALELAGRIGHTHSSAVALHYVALGCHYQREAAGALELAERCQALASEHRFRLWQVWSQLVRSWALAELGLSLMQQGLALWEASGIRAGLHHHNQGMLAEVYLRLGQPRQALEVMVHALAYRGEEHHYDSVLHRLRGECLQALGHPCQARESFLRAVEVARAQGARAFERFARERLREQAALLMEPPP